MRKKQEKPQRCKRRRNYKKESMDLAYKAVHEKGMKVKTAARMFGVPHQTLRDRVSGHVNHDSAEVGGTPVLSVDEEKVLVDYMINMMQLGYRLTNKMLKSLAGDLVFSYGRRHNNKPMSNNWIYGFLRRWENKVPSLSARRLESSSAKSAMPEAVDHYFKKLIDTLKKYNLLDQPHLIFNMVETDITPEQTVTSPHSTTTSFIGCANAIGNVLPPFYVFKGEQIDPALMNSASAGAHCAMSDSGCVNAEILKEYLQNHFLKYVGSMNTNKNQHVLLIYDGHLSIDTIEWAKKQNIVLFILPAHTSHLLQPLDVGVLGPFQTYFKTECASFLTLHMCQQITRYDLCKLASSAYLKAMTPIDIQSAFRKTGIFPYSKDVVPIHKLFSFEKEPDGKVQGLKGGQKVGKTVNERQIKPSHDLCSPSKACPTCKCTCQVKLDGTIEDSSSSEKEITDDVFHSNNEQEERKSTKLYTSHDTSKDNHTLIPESQRASFSVIDPMGNESQDPTDSEEEVDDDVPCCVCDQITPPTLGHQPYAKIVNWAQCDMCDGWVHLAFCTSVQVVGLDTSFLCPKCESD
ncbi:uncharacterized protein LOC127877322 [Dreissena polymorpha]|uniref:uncharacterized protein LOC127877322 n=1 Tax=Dreissena polymorpha TaxID=45954 RepID=UPI002263EAC8|nr:uncharacterized protein LOC127877322 [Dreissena polymorpha]